MTDGLDRYREMAAKFYGIDYEEVTEEQRRTMKRGFWGMNYAVQASGEEKTFKKASIQAQEDELFLKGLDEHMRAFNRSGTLTGRLSASQPNLSHGQGRGLPGIELADFPSLLKGLSWEELEHRALQGVDPGVLWKPEWLFPKVRSIALALVTQPTAVRNSEMGFDELKRAMPRRRRLWKKEK